MNITICLLDETNRHRAPYPDAEYKDGQWQVTTSDPQRLLQILCDQEDKECGLHIYSSDDQAVFEVKRIECGVDPELD